MQPFLEAIKATDPILLNSLTFLIGIVAGHHIALVRDKRQEFNAATAPIRADLIKSTDSGGSWIRIPNNVEIDRFEHLMWPWERAGMRKAVAACHSCCDEQSRQGEMGDLYYADPNAISASARRLLPFVKPR